MSNQILISSGAKLRDLDDVIIGTDGVLTSLGFNVANGVPKLDENGKILVSQLPNSVMEFKGVWNAATNTPTLANGTGNAGDVYLCNVAGTVNFGTGPIAFAVGDYAVYTGTVWARSSGATGTVTSVGLSRDGDALSVTGSPITTSGTINIGFAGTNLQYINGAGNLVTFPDLTVYVPTSRTLTINDVTYDLSANRTWTIDSMIYPEEGIAVSTGTAWGDSIVDNSSNWNTAYNNSIVSAEVTGTTTKTLTLDQQDGGTITASWTDYDTAPVTSVFGRTGAVVAVSGDYTTAQVTESGNLYFTNARARLAISLTTLGTSGAATYNNTTGVLNIPNYTTDLTGYVPYTGATTNVNLGVHSLSAYDLIINHTSGSGVAASITKGGNGEALTVVKSSGSGNAASITGGVTLLSELNLTTDLADAYIASAATWNAKQDAITLTTTGSSGASTLVGATLNVPNYTLAGLGGQPLATNLTSLSGLTYASTSFVKMTAAGTFSLDTNTYALASALGSYVPYTGATNNVNLGANTLQAAGITSSNTLNQFTAIYSTDPTYYTYYRNNGIYFYGTDQIYRIEAQGNTTSLMRIHSNGNIVIGDNVDAGFKLYVNGAGKFAGSLTATSISSVFKEGFIVQATTTGGGGSQPAYTYYTAAGSKRWATFLNVGDDKFHISNASNTEVFTITQSGNIGLNIQPSSWASGWTSLQVGTASLHNTGSFSQLSNNIYYDGTNYKYITTSGAVRIGFNTDGEFFVGTAASGTAGTNATMVTRLSINGSSGAASFSNSVIAGGSVIAAGSVTVGNNSGGSTNNLYLAGTDIAHKIWSSGGGGNNMYFDEYAYDGAHGFFWRNSAAGYGTMMFLTQSGLTVGGSVSGGGLLQVNGNVNINGVFQINGVTIGGGGGSGVTGSGTTNYLTKWTGSTTLGNSLVYDNGTNVGIGTTSPSERFEVNGSIKTTGRTVLGTGVGGLTLSYESGIGYINTWNSSPLVTATYGYISWETNGAERIRIIAGNGNLLLGTTSDNGYKLQINGSASFAYGFLSVYRGSSSPNDILVGNDGNRFYIGGNEYVAGSVTATGGFFDTSDARLKTLVEDNYLLSSIANVKAKLYIKNGRTELGYYAQDLQVILPYAVSEGSDGFLSLSYAQVHTAKIAVIEDEVTTLKNRVSELENKLQKYEA